MYANPQESHLRLANSLFNELITRDFSKRQRNIIDFIIRLSWGCGKEYAVIPKYTKTFNVCGINRSNIKSELDYLTLNKVIFWEKATNKFSVNKDYNEWNVPYYRLYDADIYKEILHLNLQKTNKVFKTQTKFAENENIVCENLKQFDSCKIDSEPEKVIPITNIITSIIEKSLTQLKRVENYPFNLEKDVSMLQNIEQKYPNIDLFECLDEWTVYKLDNPIKKSDNPRVQIYNWFSNAEKWGKNRKRKLTDLEIVNMKIARGEL